MSHSKLPGAGKSSFDLVDHELVFQELQVTKGKIFLDLGCGSGDYVIAAAEIINPDGIVYGIDGWSDGIETLKQRALDKGLTNITALIADITSHVPLPDNSVDICLMATVLHDFARDGGEKQALREIARVLKHNGILGIVEFKKIDGPPGPPMHIRLSPEEVTDMMGPFGFQQIKNLDVGPFTYVIVASKMNRRHQ
ncbi:MAG: SAM-dependent methyltransferase [Deltaproteobacteria bacterium]|nr:SAM-dependent methyltransferase [Deltaproteobacteria bacterium]